MSGIGLVVALRQELPGRGVGLAGLQRLETHPYPVYRTTAASSLVVQAGVGRQRAAAAARWLIRRFSPQSLLSFGFAGGLIPGLPRGTVIIGTEVVSDNGLPYWPPASHDLIEQFQTAAAAAAVPRQRGKLLTSGHIVADAVAKAELWQKSGACAVDMETLGIVEAAAEAGLPWVAVRAIADTAAETVPAACLQMLHADGRVALGQLFRSICRSPLVLRQLARLASNSALAHRHLLQTFERWTTSQAVRDPHAPRTHRDENAGDWRHRLHRG